MIFTGRLQCIPRLTERWKAIFCSRPGDIEENIYSEPSNPQIARDNRPQKGSEQAELLRNDDSMDTSSMPSYVRGADIDHGLLASGTLLVFVHLEISKILLGSMV